MLKLYITHSDVAIGTERRFNEDATVADMKEKLQLVVGTAPSMQVLQIRSSSGQILRELVPDSAPLSSFALEPLTNVHVLDVDPHRSVAKLNDLSQVEKFRLADEEYDKRSDSFRKFKERNLVKPAEKEAAERKEKEQATQEVCETEIAQAMKIGVRCEIGEKDALKRRGEVAFVGPVEFKPGYWVGVRLDEPAGKNNGSVKGRFYFQANPKHGCFVRPSQVQTGNFPEIDIFEEL